MHNLTILEARKHFTLKYYSADIFPPHTSNNKHYALACSSLPFSPTVFNFPDRPARAARKRFNLIKPMQSQTVIPRPRPHPLIKKMVITARHTASFSCFSLFNFQFFKLTRATQSFASRLTSSNPLSFRCSRRRAFRRRDGRK